MPSSRTQRGDLLPEEAVEQYHHVGYCVSPVIFGDDEIARIRAAFERIYNGELDEGQSWPYVPPVVTDNPFGIRTALFSAYVSQAIRRVVGHPRLVAMAAQLLDVEEIRLWQDQAIWKPGTNGVGVEEGNIGFHQDYAYWQDSSTTNMVSANIALQDVTLANGALQVFPGSHLMGLLGDFGDFFNTDISSLRDKFRHDFDLDREVVLELKAGQVSFHHSLTVHGSGHNETTSPRLVLAPAYMPADTYYRQEGQPSCPHSEFLGADRVHGTSYATDHFPLL